MRKSRYVLKCTKDKKRNQYVYILKSAQCGKISFRKSLKQYRIKIYKNAVLYIYLFHTQSTHIDKSYINSNAIIHRINDKYIIMPGHITVNKILRNNHK